MGRLTSTTSIISDWGCVAAMMGPGVVAKGRLIQWSATVVERVADSELSVDPFPTQDLGFLLCSTSMVSVCFSTLQVSVEALILYVDIFYVCLFLGSNYLYPWFATQHVKLKNQQPIPLCLVAQMESHVRSRNLATR